ncbi:3-methyl-2-oxobutanoate hydroxymethyltransferase [Fusarium keratoplasticum]|uniref:3-methyl-2-oxobutanoate hydroxymethyltransferase n=1 Tax=Fusarium keratoplasticum TaxID=1328300 RepID=A0ACC0QQK9_9HYPO|nr:3-methyl-2-oxobutanoate hydroxymethyltransferase [Fusarium keratoplasticum]KAI8661078.1 3-methyl-2-oxobutanoate hydroxymethyltransferase [Fusarium keratoplasticum]
MYHLDCTPYPKMTTALARLRAVAAKRKLVCVTAWDFPRGLLAETAGIDLVLVGDSLGITALGYKDTKAVTLDEMVHHTRAVGRAFKTGFLLADLPLGSYEKSTEHAIESAIRLVKEAGAHGVKLEGGCDVSPTIRAISKAGIPVIGHIGLTLQRDLDASNQVDDSNDACAGVLADAKSVQDAGAVAVVVEAVASQTAAKITSASGIPTIGIG